MKLRFAGTTYLDARQNVPRCIDDAHLLIDTAGITVRRRTLRKLLSARWADLAFLDVEDSQGFKQTVLSSRCDYPVSIAPFIDKAGGSILTVGTTTDTYWLLCLAWTSDQLRRQLADWTLGEATADPVGMATDPAETANRAVSAWRAASLGREPLTDRRTALYRLTVANNKMYEGDLLGAIVLYESLLARGEEAFGPDDDYVLAVCSNLAHATALAGDRATAIAMHWHVLDAARECSSEAQITAVQAARGSLARLHDPGWRP